MQWIFNGPGIVKGYHEPKSFFIEKFESHIIRSFSNRVTEAIELQQQILPIYIESPGGDMYVLNGILSVMDSARKKGLKFATITSGQAMSAGAFVFCYGDEDLRFMGQEAILMLHGLSAGFEGRVTEMKGQSDIYEKYQYSTFEKISKHLKKKSDWLKKEMDKRKDKDWYLTSQEAKAINLANHIDIPTFTVNVEASVHILV